MEIDQPPEQNFEPAGPRPILKLGDDVINKIAAAEVSSYSLEHKAILIPDFDPYSWDIAELLDHSPTRKCYQRVARKFLGRRLNFNQIINQRGRIEINPNNR